MKVKKILALALAGVMTLSMGMVAFAEENDTTQNYNDMSQVTITKIYQAANEGTKSPVETFTLKQIGDGQVKDGDADIAPALGTITGAEFASGAATTDGATGSITVNLPNYEKVGIYEYILREESGSTAGVEYHSGDIKLVVTVIQGEDGRIRVAAVHTEAEGGTKTGSFKNTYSAGSLSVTKKVTGNLGDKEKEFNVTVTFTAPDGKKVGEAISYTDGTEPTTIAANWTGNKATATITLKDSETVTFNNIPYGVTYTVVEADYTGANGGYDEASYTGTDVKNNVVNGVVSEKTETVTITNNKGGDVDTGISLDNIPYILMLCLVVFGAAALFFKKRSALDR